MNTRIEDWLTEPPADLRPDSTDEEVRAIHQRVIEDAIARHLPLEGESPMAILLRMRADLSGHVWEHSFECHACGKYEGCQMSCRTLFSGSYPSPSCPWDMRGDDGDDLAEWIPLGVRQVPIPEEEP